MIISVILTKIKTKDTIFIADLEFLSHYKIDDFDI